MESVSNFINGKFSAAREGTWLDVHEPATGKTVAQVADSNDRDINDAVLAARAAAAGWARTPTRERSALIRKLSVLVLAHQEELAQLESVDTGKPIALARKLDIPRSAHNLEFFADAITQFSSESHAMDGAVHLTFREPLGVVACISPWNLPLYLLTWKIAPALVSGNTVIAKPSELTPRTAHRLAELSVEAGIPKGVLNVVHGLGGKAGASLVSHPDVKAISFTGGTATGRAIALASAPAFKKLSLEMGGKNATIVFADICGDADFDHAVREAARAAYLNQGQICLCGSRILVEKQIYERFRDALVAHVRALRVGDPMLETTEQGAIVSKAQLDKVLLYTELSKKEGGRILAGGSRIKVPGRCEEGWFMAPTLVEGLSANCRVNQEEIFGPLATLLPFNGEEEAIKIANGTRYGLAASVFTTDGSRALRVGKALQTGVVWINSWLVRDLRTPFGGSKDSGLGREGGLEALRFFTEPKNMTLSMTHSEITKGNY